MRSLRYTTAPEIEESDYESDQDLNFEAGICTICGYAIYENDLVMTARGPMHESCADSVFPYDPGDSVWPK